MSFNHEAYTEREKNKEFILVSGTKANKILTVDTKKVTHNGFKWVDLGEFGKRKFENLLIFDNMYGDTIVRYV